MDWSDQRCRAHVEAAVNRDHWTNENPYLHLTSASVTEHKGILDSVLLCIDQPIAL